jgi:putative spermidine/putrescine transport system permease protein
MISAAKAHPVAAGEARRTGWSWLVPGLLLAPSVLIVALFYLVPFLAFAHWSFGPETSATNQPTFFTLYYYEQLVNSKLYRTAFENTLELGVVVTLGCLVLGYIVVLFLHHSETRHTDLYLAFFFIPMQLSAVVRAFGWKVLLSEPNGLVNQVLSAIGLGTIPFVNTFWGVAISLIHVNLLFMILALLVSFRKIDRSQESAAASLGARPWRIFLHVTLPLSLPGLITGTVVVFILSMFELVTAAIMGGGRVPLVSTVVFDLILGTVNWAQGTALALATVIVALVLVGAYYLGMRRLLYEERIGTAQDKAQRNADA